MEGESEIELFTNKYIKALFPFLKQFDVYKALSNDVIRKVIYQNNKKTRTPYLQLVDMDKIISYDKTDNCFNWKNYMKENNLHEKYLINQKRNYSKQKRYALLKRLIAMTEKCRFHRFTPLYSCIDNNFYEYVEGIKHYYSQYNTFVFSTTLEGAIINNNSMANVYNFTKSKKQQFYKFDQIYNNYKENDQLNLLRLLYEGKTDLLLKNKDTDLDKRIKDNVIGCNLTKKTSGWITEFINYYFEDYLGVVSIEEMLEQTEIKNEFETMFPEIANIMELCNKMIYNAT